MLAEGGAKVAIFDRDVERGEAKAKEIGGVFCNVDVVDGDSVTAGLSRGGSGAWCGAHSC